MNRKLITNLDTDEDNDLSAVNMITLKKFHPNAPAPTHEVTKDIDLKDRFSVINSKENVLSFYKSHYATLMPFADIQDNFLSRVEEFPMQTQLNMNHNSITNLKDPVFGGEAATKAYIDSAYSTIVSSTATSIATKLDLSGGKMTGSIDMNKNKVINLSKPTEVNDAVNMDYVNTKIEKIKKRIAKSTITATSHPKDEFRYLWKMLMSQVRNRSVALFAGQNLNMTLVDRKSNSRRFGGTSVGNPPVFTFNQKVEKDEFFFIILGGAFTNVKAAMLIEIG